MSVPDASDFLLRFPEFGEQSFTVVEETLAEAGRYVALSVWGDIHTDGVTYLAAHLLATRTMQIGLQVGSISGSPLGTGLDSTLYGQEYKRLQSSLALTGFVY